MDFIKSEFEKEINNMKIMSVDNSYNRPQFQALTIEKQSLPALREKGQALVDKLVEVGKEFKNYSHFDMRVYSDEAKPLIESKDGKLIYKDFYRAAIPLSKDLNISSKFGKGEYSGVIRQFLLKFSSKSEALDAFNKISGSKDKDMIESAVELTRLLEADAIKRKKAAEQVNIDGLSSYIV